MKNFVSIAFMFAMILSASLAFGQSYTFRVLANKGSNQVKRAGASGTEALKTGATLNSGDQLIVSDGAYIGLMHKSGKTTEVRTAGTKKVSDLEKNITVGTTSVASRYARFVASKMNEEENTNYRSRMAATGAVSRATNAAIMVMAPTQVNIASENKVIGDQAIIRWKRPDEMSADDAYVVSVKNIFDEVIYTTETENEFVELDFTAEQMKNDVGLYILSVSSKSKPEVKSDDVGIKRATDAEISASLASLKSEVTEDSPLNKLIYASFYEENGLLLDALTKYEEAVKMAPEIQDFQDLYDNFKIVYGFEEDAK
eukprot:gnl/TRDRNA2_/TRDRNA2_85016_c1_seq1.p1 gnl/TRDRNA2_/TRDRNA2_85016_c1~~gnl/TRDRNA2_/TRDRNA2_85016_c1_seq1.p1  ORF type:complete len:314 (+),score=27.08 gnl/TRDRNA2_/TRDRNA2_85016_c1_seq1:225-1166(+)